MFKKALNFKGETKLGGKQIKKLKEEVSTQLSASSDSQSALLPSKADVSLRKLGGGSYAQFYYVDGQPVFIQPDPDSLLIPSLPALWKVGANLLPVVRIFPPVAKFVFKGANLMVPGIHSIEVPNDSRVGVGSLVAIRAIGNPSACAVGWLRISPEQIISRIKGEAVELAHYFGDTLWESCGSPRPAGFEGDSVKTTDAAEVAALCSDATGPSGIDEETGEGKADGDSMVEQLAPPESDAENESNENEAEEKDDADGPAVMDKLLYESFLQAVKTRIQDKELPMVGNNVYAQHIRPSRPVGTSVDVKTSSYKKQATFFAHLESEGLIALKKSSKEPVVTKILRDHPDIREWVPWSETAEGAQAVPVGGEGGYAPKAVPVAAATIQVEPVWKVDKQVGSLIGAVGDVAEEYLTQARCKEVVQRYIEQKKLLKENNKKRFSLDEDLLKIVSGDDEDAKRGWSVDAFADRLLTSLKLFHRVATPQGGAKGGVKVSFRQGKPPMVSIKSAMRRGHPVTLACGLENYGVDLETFAKELQKVVAASTGVETEPQLGVYAQGFFDEAISQKIVAIGVPEQFIQNEVKKGQHQKKVKQASNVRKT